MRRPVGRLRDFSGSDMGGERDGGRQARRSGSGRFPPRGLQLRSYVALLLFGTCNAFLLLLGKQLYAGADGGSLRQQVTFPPSSHEISEDLDRAHKIIGGFEYPGLRPSSALHAGVGPCNRSVPLLHVIISGIDPPPGKGRPISSIRLQEYREAFIKTLGNPEVKRLHVLAERGAMPQFIASTLDSLPVPEHREKVLLGRTNVGRLTFSAAIQYANEAVPRGEAALVTNADIAVESGFSCDNLGQGTLLEDTLLIPQRFEDDGCPSTPHYGEVCDVRHFMAKDNQPDCFDSYLFKAPLRPQEITNGTNFDILTGGEWQAENEFVALLRNLGVSVYSPPAGKMRLLHKHCSQERPNQQSQRPRPKSKDGVCYEEFCAKTCTRNHLPFMDPLANICKDLDLCTEYGKKLRLYSKMHQLNFPQVACDADPVQVLLLPNPSSLKGLAFRLAPTIANKARKWKSTFYGHAFVPSLGVYIWPFGTWISSMPLLVFFCALDCCLVVLPVCSMIYVLLVFVFGHTKVQSFLWTDRISAPAHVYVRKHSKPSAGSCAFMGRTYATNTILNLLRMRAVRASLAVVILALYSLVSLFVLKPL